MSSRTAALLTVGALIVGLAISACWGAELTADQVQHVTKTNKVPLLSQPREVSRFAWPGLGQTKTIALGEALTKAHFKAKVMIWCATIDCTELAADFDDAFQIAGVQSDIDRREIDSSSDHGVFVGPPGPDADKLVQALVATTGLRVGIVEAPHDAPLALIIGKKPR
jgi:hypothetical protein